MAERKPEGIMANDSTTAAVDETERVIPQGQGHDAETAEAEKQEETVSPVRRKQRRNFPAGRADKHHHLVNAEGLMDRDITPVDEWRLIETKPNGLPLGLGETLFALSNGYIGMRGNPPEGRDSSEHGTYINGLHETWPIRHAEDAYGLARQGQTIVNAPDAKAMRLYIDDEPLRLGNAEVSDYERSLDFREGVLRRRFIWRTPGGKHVRVTSERMVSFQEKHVAAMSLEVELLDADAAVMINSQILNRQDGEDEYHDAAKAQGTELDPRRAEALEDRVLIPAFQSESAHGQRSTLGYRCANSGMTVATSMDHTFTVRTPDGTEPFVEVSQSTEPDVASSLFNLDAPVGTVIRLEKLVAYHSSRKVRAEELAFRCERTLNRVGRIGMLRLMENQEEWLERFWERSDVVIYNQPEIQQAVRWNIWQIIQAAARAEFQGVPAKGMTGTGYGGHYFWDTEIYVTPFLTYTSPQFSRNAMRFRWDMLEAAWARADELAHDGALFPWRTINGQESSAYFEAGTAQYHIDADIVYAMMKYVYASGDEEFLLKEGTDLLLGTARFWMSLGFFDAEHREFQIHSVTGPDEYNTVVNNNLYTNVMAQYNLRVAADVVKQMKRDRPAAYRELTNRFDLTEREVEEWEQAAEAMYIPFDEKLGIHPQDDQFLLRKRWNLDDPEVGPLRPLLLHYHPLTIYRHQVIKQADVVLALFLMGNRFTTEQKRADYMYYDPLTTGDSSLSAVVQSIVAAELGLQEQAMDFFLRGLYVDLANLHGNAADGVHVASAGGVWQSLVYGFGGFRDHDGRYSIDPRLPEDWSGLTYRVTIHGCRIRVTVRGRTVEVALEEGDHQVGPIMVAGHEVIIGPEPLTVVMANSDQSED
ncbi:glycosyl hydrolase family 65 protein [Corynebacterium amycolatum]|uniref:glycoside hydrolase family 65 protein n=1 Tax=Corynebacterium amycolatum TaxID=43765 RepID=UPI002AAD08E1|nr:glycosyl hydrolase family 65 protein [Corynebacterium amycolatum]MDY7341087.1 glycosyl hydrolase family 65 protein [Corynebacterium amycolatum]